MDYCCKTKDDNPIKEIPVKKATLTQKGRATVVFPDEESLKKANDALSGEFKVTSISKKETKLLPKIKLTGIDQEYIEDVDRKNVKEILTNEIKMKNTTLASLIDDKEAFEIIYVDKKSGTAVIKVSQTIRTAIKNNNDKIHIGLQVYHIEDEFHVIQCYHCQAFGHTVGSPQCQKNNAGPTCFYCAGEHISKNCNVKKNKKQHSCTNCLNSGDSYIKSRATSHNATDHLCPFVIKETKRTIERTEGSNESKNIYMRKIKTLKKQKKDI